MLFSGNNFRVIPETNLLGFVFSGIIINGTGSAEIGFSGYGNHLKFRFSNNRVFAPDNKFISTYNTGEPLTINGYIKTGDYQFSLNNAQVSNRKSKSNFLLQRFLINSTGSTVESDIKLFCPTVDTEISVAESFNALTYLTGYVSNHSTISYKIFDSSLFFFQNASDLLSGNITGVVTGNSSGLFFNLTDLNTSRFDNEVKFLVNLDTSLGPISGTFTSNRVSGLDYEVRKFTTSSTGAIISGLFDGSGHIPNKFIFTPDPLSASFNYYVSVNNLRGEQKSKEIDIEFENLSHVENSAYRASYVTGFQLTNSGQYLIVPTAKFTGYYYVTGLDWNLSTMILSYGCSGNIPVTFSGLGGRGASGYIVSNRTFLSGIYAPAIEQFYLPYQFNLSSGGTGYLETPRAYIHTGLYNNCFDVALNSGSSSIYVPFNGSGLLTSRANYLTGEVLYTTGLLSGGQLTGYIVTGLLITNPGSGYDSNFLPLMSFIRNTGDGLITGASGSFLMKSSGTYKISENWSVKTGISNSNLYDIGNFSTGFSLPFNQNYFTIQVSFSGTDHTEPIATKLTVSLVGGDTIIHNISGIKYYDTSTGFLKKKHELGTTKYVAESLLSFSLSQSDLDNYYSSSEYINNPEISFGDLDF